MGSRGSSSGRGRGNTLKGYEQSTNTAIQEDIIRERASKPNGISYRQSEKMAKVLDKNTENGDRLALMKVVRDPNSKAGAKVSDEASYQIERVEKGTWKVIDGAGREVKTTTTDGALRFIDGADYSMQQDKKYNVLQYYKKKK